MNKLLELTEKTSQWAVWISGTMVLLTAFMIAVEVVLRKVFVLSMGGADEISTYVLAMCCSWSLGFALFRKAHIRIDLLYGRFSRSVQIALDIVSLVLFAVYTIMLTYFGFIVVSTSWIRSSAANTPLATPLWIPQGIWFLGILGFTLIILLLLAGTIYNILRKDYAKAQKWSGAMTVEEDIKEEGVKALEGEGK